MPHFHPSSDIYSPSGDRLRSKIEMVRHLAGTMDLSAFDFKSGLFMDTMAKCGKKRGVSTPE